MPVQIIDACAVLAYIQNEPGAELVEEILTDPTNECVIHAINLCEVYTIIFSRRGQALAGQVVRDVEDYGIERRDDFDQPFLAEVGGHRATIISTVKNPVTGGCHSIALADCFTIALALRLGGTVVTSDHNEFDYVQQSRICPVTFFR